MSQSAKYEILYIIRPNIEEDNKKALVERFETILKDNGAEVTESKDWAKRRLYLRLFRWNKIANAL